MESNPRSLEIFRDVQRGLPRQGPGSDESTLRALSLCGGLPHRPAVLDIGCGPGMQTIALSQATSSRITALDIHQEYLNQLKDKAELTGVSARIDILIGDMNSLPFRPQTFDLVWSEGAAYIMGIERALADWKQYLRPGGCIALTELVWLKPDPPKEIVQFFDAEYPAMTEAKAISDSFRTEGYEMLGHFTLPDSAWWDYYYTPLEAKLPALSDKYAGDDLALEIIGATKQEIEMRRVYHDWYGYEFFIARLS